MNQNLTLLEKLCFATVRIVCKGKDKNGNDFESSGTGFIYNFELNHPSDIVALIITNKHVIEDAKVISFNITQAITTSGPWTPDIGKHHKIDTDILEWTLHPDKDIDLCFTYLIPAIKKLPHGIEPFYQAFDKSLIPFSDAHKERLDAVEDVVMIGYPNGLWDSLNNLPIIRKGTSATHPAIKLEGKTEFMIDVACYPGSSGSPVILHYKGGRGTRTGGFEGGEHIYFLGILYAGPTYDVDGNIIVLTIPTSKVVARLEVLLNLGMVIFAEEIFGFETDIRKNFGK